ncbi:MULTISPECIES: oxygenase MpaB family protein [unclassified Arthrobacter]|uniref:oxygenase MpaB family protein n=1 Tax=unclassified Arthrobacter TaxID=235627 RepID=UPI003397DCE1
MVRTLADIGAEVVLLAGAGRAILLQIANPAVGHGVAEHSDFAGRPLERFRSTVTYVYAVVYGNEDQVAAVRRRVNRAHSAVRRKPDAGSHGYSAFDAQAQLWVVATLYDTAVTVYEKIYGPLDDETSELMYQDYARIGTVLQLPAELWPADRAAFRTYWDARLQVLELDTVTARVGRELLYPPAGPLWLRMSMPLIRFITAGLLPDHLRSSYGLPWSDRHSRLFDRTTRWSALVYPRLPRTVRHFVKDYCLGRLRTA